MMQQCEYCKRWFKNKRGRAIHLAVCKIKKLKELISKVRKQNISIHTITQSPDIDSKIRNLEGMIK